MGEWARGLAPGAGGGGHQAAQVWRGAGVSAARCQGEGAWGQTAGLRRAGARACGEGRDAWRGSWRGAVLEPGAQEGGAKARQEVVCNSSAGSQGEAGVGLGVRRS